MMAVAVLVVPLATAIGAPAVHVATKTAMYVLGTDADEYIKLTPRRDGSIDVSVNKVTIATQSPDGLILVAAMGGNDRVTLSSAIANRVMVFAGDGNALVETANGAAVVVGAAGDDRIVTRSGRDIVVGGTGADRISAGSGDDLVIAGPTVRDVASQSNIESWCAIHSEWTSSSSYRVRVGHLTGVAPGGRNGTALLRAGVETSDDESVDPLDGAGGNDWFHANRVAPGPSLDKLSRSSSEVLSEL